MKATTIIVLISFLFWGCSQENNNPVDVQETQPLNIVILLDLSDRLLSENQISNDISLISEAFKQFVVVVRQTNLIINSKDKFRVAIAPQKNLSYDPISYMDALYLDMGTIPMALRRDSLESFERRLIPKLKSLYSACVKGQTKKEDFAGCDLWKYFNEQLPSDLESDAKNVLILLTDGYFDFEDNPNVIDRGNRSTSTAFLSKIRNLANPLDVLKKGNYGLIKPEKDFDHVQVAVMEMNLKSDNLYEPELLKAIWSNWLHEMGINSFSLNLKGSLPKSTSKLREFLQNIGKNE